MLPPLRLSALIVLVLLGGLAFHQYAYQKRASTPTEQPTVMLAMVNRTEISKGPEQLVLPDFVDSIKPLPNTEVSIYSQISIAFNTQVIELGALDQTTTTEALGYFKVEPVIPGKFRFANPNLVVFEPTAALPAASRLQVSLLKGLRMLDGRVLGATLEWTFEVAPLTLSNRIESPTPLNPTLYLSASAPVLLEELRQLLSVRNEETGRAVELKVALSYPKDATVGTEFQILPALLPRASRFSLAVREGLKAANGNLPSKTPVATSFYTFYPLSVTFYWQPAALGNLNTPLLNGYPILKFNNPLAPESVTYFTLQPLPRSPDPFYDRGNGTVVLDPNQVTAATDYVVRISRRLRDRFDQQLPADAEFRFHAGDYRPMSWIPSGTFLIPPAISQTLDLHFVNQNDLIFHWQSIKVEDLRQMLNIVSQKQVARIQDSDFKPPLERSEQVRDLPLNMVGTHRIDLPKHIASPGGVLRYGMGPSGERMEQIPKGLVIHTDLAVHTFFTPRDLWIQINRLSSGLGLADAEIQFYNQTLRAPCGEHRADANGSLFLEAADLRACAHVVETPAGSVFESEPNLLVIVRQDPDWTFAFSRLELYDYRPRDYDDEYGGDYDGDYYYGGYSGCQGYSFDWTGESCWRVAVFSDRSLYKPGERVTITGLARRLRFGALVQPKESAVRLGLRDPEGNETDLGDVALNDMGAFTHQIELPANATLGHYDVIAKSVNDQTDVGRFRVAEFRAPPFKVESKTGNPVVLEGDDQVIQLSGAFLNGAPLGGASAEVRVNRTPIHSRSTSFGDFSTSKTGYLFERLKKTVTLSGHVTQTRVTYDEAGRHAFDLPITNLPIAASYQVEAEVNDASNASLSTSTGFIAYPTRNQAGIRMQEMLLTDAAKAVAEVVVLNPEGKLVSGQKLIVRTTLVKWMSVNRELRNGVQIEHAPEVVATGVQEIISAGNPIPVTLQLGKGGEYMVEVEVAGDPAHGSGANFYYSDKSQVNWYVEDSREVEVVLNKTNFVAGETAQALVKVPYDDCEVMFMVVRDRTFHREWRRVTKSSPTFSFPITPDMVPNAEIRVVVTRVGAIGKATEMMRKGRSSFSVGLEQLRLDLKLTPRLASLEPKEEQTVDVVLTDSAGKPVEGHVTVAVVNEAILQLNRYRFPDLVEYFYQPFPWASLETDTRNVIQLLPRFKPFNKGWGYGGGALAGMSDSQLRQDFQPTPYYKLDLRTNAEGKASVRFKMPDDLTTWRILGAAADKEQRFANADSTFRTSKLLIAEPILPRFARLRDTFDAGLQVINATGKPAEVEVEGTFDGPISFVINGKPAKSFTRKISLGTLSTPVRVSMKAEALGTATLRVSVRGLGALAGVNDGFKVPLQVTFQQPMESTVYVGATVKNKEAITMNVNAGNIDPELGGLHIEASSTLLVNVVEPLRGVIDYPYGCAEQTTSRILAILSLQWLTKHYDFKVSDPIGAVDLNKELAYLLTMQRDDGGFAFWPGMAESSHPTVTAYVAEALVMLKEAGYKVPDASIENARVFLGNSFGRIHGKNHWALLQVHLGLLTVGGDRDDRLEQLYSERKQLRHFERLQLAQILLRKPHWKMQARTLMEELGNQMVFDGRTASLAPQTNDPWYWFYSGEVEQAMALRVFAQYTATPDTTVDRLLRGLLDARQKGRWSSTYADIRALLALIDFAKAREAKTPQFTTTMRLADKTVLKHSFNRFEQTVTLLAMKSLPPGRSTLDIERQGSGTLHYLARYEYAPLAIAAGQESGITVERQISEMEPDRLLAEFKLPALAKPLDLRANKTYRVNLKVNIKRWSAHVAVTDHLPAGLEAVDSQLATTSSRYATGQNYDFDYREIADRRVSAFLLQANPGEYNLTYYARAVTPGKYTWPGGEAQLMYTPETFGRTAAATLNVIAP